MKKLLSLSILVSQIFLNSSPAQAMPVSARWATSVAFYQCKNSDSWTKQQSSWRLAYNFKINGAYVLFATTGMGIFNVTLTPFKRYAVIRPADSASKRIWKIEGCTSKNKIIVDFEDNGRGSVE